MFFAGEPFFTLLSLWIAPFEMFCSNIGIGHFMEPEPIMELHAFKLFYR